MNSEHSEAVKVTTSNPIPESISEITEPKMMAIVCNPLVKGLSSMICTDIFAFASLKLKLRTITGGKTLSQDGEEVVEVSLIVNTSLCVVLSFLYPHNCFCALVVGVF